MTTFTDNAINGTPGGDGLDDNNFLTQDQIKGMEEAAKDSAKGQQQAAKASWNFADAAMTAAGQALAASHSFRELRENGINAIGGLLNQLGANLVGGGPFGTLVGGLFQFGWNLATSSEETLPIKDGAMETRIVNWSDGFLAFANVRDRSERSFNKRFRDEWALAGASAQRGG